MKVTTTKMCLIKGNRVRPGVVIDVTLKKGHKLPAHLIPVGKEPKNEPEPEVDTLTEMGKTQPKAAKDSKTPVK